MPILFHDYIVNITISNKTHIIFHKQITVVLNGSWIQFTTSYNAYPGHNEEAVAYFIGVGSHHLSPGNYTITTVVYGHTGTPSRDVSFWNDIYIKLTPP